MVVINYTLINFPKHRGSKNADISHKFNLQYSWIKRFSSETYK